MSLYRGVRVHFDDNQRCFDWVLNETISEDYFGLNFFFNISNNFQALDAIFMSNRPLESSGKVTYLNPNL